MAKRFTIYDAMEAKGVFNLNPANATSPEFQGAIEYPKMLFHPKGEKRQTVAPEIIVTPMGPKEVGAQFELIYEIAHNSEDEARLVGEGWWLSPADSIEAGGGKRPATSPQGQISALQKQIAALEKQLAAAREEPPASSPSNALRTALG